MQTTGITGRFAVDAKTMLGILTDPDLVVRHHRLQGAVEARVEELDRSEQVLRQRVHVREHWRNMKGVDERRIEPATIDYRWDLARRACDWTYHGARGDQVQLGGRISISPLDDACRVESEVEVRVPVPLIGRLIEKRIIAEVQAGFEPFRELIQEFCDREDRP